MKMRLKAIGRVPYGGGFKINRPDLGMVGTGTAFDMLDRNVRAYRKANGIPTGLGFSEELEQQISELYPDEAEMVDPDLPRQMVEFRRCYPWHSGSFEAQIVRCRVGAKGKRGD